MDSAFLSPHARSVLLDDRQCTATNRDGDRCGRSAALGAFVCDKHGAKTPSAKRAAQERLLALAEPAIGALHRALNSHGPPCPHCGRSDADRDPNVIRAAQIVLDRTGFGPRSTIEIEPQEPVTRVVREIVESDPNSHATDAVLLDEHDENGPENPAPARLNPYRGLAADPENERPALPNLEGENDPD